MIAAVIIISIFFQCKPSDLHWSSWLEIPEMELSTSRMQVYSVATVLGDSIHVIDAIDLYIYYIFFPRILQ